MEEVTEIKIPNYLFKKLVSHAEKNLPYESVSIISGKYSDGIAEAKEVYLPENKDKSTTSFTVDSNLLLDIYLDIEKKGNLLIGIFHTHPAPPKPSSTDRHYMEVNPYVWLISSSNNITEPKGYILIEENKIKEVQITII